MIKAFTKITNKIIFLVIISNLLFGCLIVFVSSTHLLNVYESEFDSRVHESITAKRLNFESNIYKIESTVDALRVSIEEIYVSNSDMYETEDQVHSLFTHYLLTERAVSHSLYAYFNPDIDENVHDVWLTNEANTIIRHEEIPLERYQSQENMTWFFDVKEKLVSHWVPPYRNRFNQYISSYVMPITVDDQFIGIIGMYLDINKVRNLLSPLNSDDKAFYWVLNDLDEIVYHPTIEEGKKLSDTNYIFLKTEDVNYFTDGTNYRHYVSSTHNGWQFIYTVDETLVDKERNVLIYKFIGSTFGFLLILQMVILVISRKFKAQFKAILKVLKLARQGDFTTKIHISSHDELGQLAYEINETHDRINKLKHSLEKLAYYNKSTGLPNWGKLQIDIQHTIGDKDVVMYLIDLDNLKQINNLIGRQRADQLIRILASRLQELEGDEFILYNIQNNQFIYIETASDYSMITEHAQMILDVFEQYTYSTNCNFSITCSIGIAKYPDDAVDSEELLSHAKIALEESKTAGKSTYKLYSRFMLRQSADTSELDADIVKAIKNHEFEVHYQARFNIDNQLTGFEALLRWHHPSKGFLYPSNFLEFAEKSGAINPIGDWVLNKVCEDYLKLKEHQIFPSSIAINISARQLLSPLLISSILGILRNDDIDAEILELEVREEMLMYDRKKTLKKLNALRVAGMKISIEHYGKKEVSMKNMVEFPLARIKIDKTLVADIQNQQSRQLIQNIITTSHNIGLLVTAVGVENEEQYKYLKTLNCDEYQGFLFAEPHDIKTIINEYKK